MPLSALIGLRFALAFALLFATWNPTGHSWVHELSTLFPRINGLFALFSVILTAAWVVLLRAVFRAIGVVGVLLLSSLFGALVWVGHDFGLVQGHARAFGAWLVLFLVAVVHSGSAGLT